LRIAEGFFPTRRKGHREGAPDAAWGLLESSCPANPKTDKLEHTNTIKTMTDEELESAIAFLHEMMAAQAVGSAMKAEPAALPAPGGQSPEKLSSKRKPNRLMIEVDTAIGPFMERIPRRMRAPADD
jgi:hypothetical protein